MKRVCETPCSPGKRGETTSILRLTHSRHTQEYSHPGMSNILILTGGSGVGRGGGGSIPIKGGERSTHFFGGGGLFLSSKLHNSLERERQKLGSHHRDNVTMFSGSTKVENCTMSIIYIYV